MREKVFGIGLSRTGTTSLTEALRTLGYRAVHCPLSILSIRRGALELSTDIVERYDAFTDSPVARMYRELDQAYPGSKFILTTRATDKWLRSMKRMRPSFALLKMLPKVNRMVRDFAGTTSFGDEKALRNAYSSHCGNVCAYFGDRQGKDLLVFDINGGDGWDKLCGFLGHEAPSMPFPHYNRGYGTTFGNMRDLIRHSWPLL